MSLEQQRHARNIFDRTWAMDSGTEITPNLLQAMVHSGSYLSGAFIDGKCVGAAFAFPAATGGLHLHSHMTAVLDEYRDQGVGYALKIDQIAWEKINASEVISGEIAGKPRVKEVDWKQLISLGRS